LPKECYGRAWVQKINGVVVYREEAQPTPDESARRREQSRQQEEVRKETARQKRHDDALLERYPSLEVLDQRRDREIAELDKAIGVLRVDEERLIARRKTFDDEMKTFESKPLPDDLKKAIRYADEELAQARAAIERKANERDGLRQRFDADRQRYLEITLPKSASGSQKD
jgi:predicted RNase H-like nuclease (RuvC/YqgF family)